MTSAAHTAPGPEAQPTSQDALLAPDHMSCGKGPNILAHWAREAGFLLKDKGALAALLVLLVLSSVAALAGLVKVAAQEREIAAMIAEDAGERGTAQAGLSSYGDAAYYSFYLTWDAPAPLAFAAVGARDTAPYIKRVRMLAIEGQIYQGESPNPLLAQIGMLDLAFVAAYVLPLVLIVLLHDLKARERAAGRLTLLEAMPSAWARLWLPRSVWRSALAFVMVALPFASGAVVCEAAFAELASGLLALLAVTIFWGIAAVLVALSPWRSAATGAALVGIWLTLNVLVPTLAQNVFVPMVEGPDGADVALVQREAVNDAWDMPKSATLGPFFERLPQYRIDGDLKPFDWRWYFAFQYMGDVQAADLSQAYRDAIRARDQVAASASWFSPALAVQRHLQHLGQTDITAQLAYDTAIRDYHSQLQGFFLPLVFGSETFDLGRLQDFPRYVDDNDAR